MPTGQYSLTDAKPLGQFSLADVETPKDEPQAQSPQDKQKWADDLAKNPDGWRGVVTGVAKGAARTAVNVSDLPTMFGGAGGPDYADLVRGKAQGTTRKELADLLAYKNTAQKIGGYGETAAELLVPAGMAVKAGLAAQAGTVPGAMSSILDASGKPMQMAPQAITYAQRIAAMLPSNGAAREAVLAALKYGGLPASAVAGARWWLK